MLSKQFSKNFEDFAEPEGSLRGKYDMTEINILVLITQRKLNILKKVYTDV